MSKRGGRPPESRQRVRERRRGDDQLRQDRAVDGEHAATRVGVPPPVIAVPPADSDSGAEVLASGRRVAGQHVECGWCGQPIILRPTGRMPKWCSAACRQRAWEQARSAASGQTAVRVVDRYVAAVPADVPGWTALLGVLAGQVMGERGRIADRDLGELAAALDLASGAVASRAGLRGRSSRD